MVHSRHCVLYYKGGGTHLAMVRFWMDHFLEIK